MRLLASVVVLSLAAVSAVPAAQAKRYTVPELAKAMAPAVVFIGNVDSSGQVQSIGSGFVVHADGIIVTNYHVIEGANALQVKMKDGEIYDRVEVVDHDERRDIAVLKIRAFKKLPTLALASEQPEPGEEAVAIGNPQGLEHTVSVGVVSAYRQAQGFRLMQISVPISPGSSGGPLFNIRGEVVGITSAGVTAEGAQNLNFAVPIDYARPLITATSVPVPIAEFSRKVGAAPRSAAAPAAAAPARGNTAKGSDQPLGAWRVVHDHGDVFETFCVGVFYFSADKMGFTNDSNVHVWEVPLSALREIAKNAVYGADKHAFHVRLITNTNYNFVAVNDQLQFGPSDPIIIALMSHLKK